MPGLDVLPVRMARERRTFLTFPWRIYGEDPLWVPPLLPEHAKRVDPERGAFFKRGGEAELFIAWQDNRPVGTICAGEDKFTNAQRGKHECIFGFFECVEDYSVAEALLSRAVGWARERELNALLGPFNLDYEDRYGILIEGRERPAPLLCGHTPTYYQDLVERFGFTPARGDNLAYAIDLTETPALRRLSRLARRVRERRDISIREVDLTRWDEEIDLIHRLLNTALAHLPGFIGWHREAVESMLSSFRPIADPELVLFGEVDGEPVGWLPGIANLNEALIHVNGLRHPWDYAKLWWHTRRQPECLTLKSVLVLPAYWGTGVSIVMFDEMARRARAGGFRWVDLSLTSEDNPNTPVLADRMGAEVYKRYRVYRLDL